MSNPQEAKAPNRAQALQQKIDEGKVAAQELSNLQTGCRHIWGEATYAPVVSGGYSTPGDVPGTMGVDFRGPQYVPREERPRWRRVCQGCGKIEFTEQKRVIKTEPVFPGV